MIVFPVFLILKIAALVWEVYVMAMLWRRRHLNRMVFTCLFALFLSHALGDLTNIVTGEYAFPKAITAATAIWAKFLLRFVHVAFVALVLGTCRKSLKLIPQEISTWLGAAIIMPFLARFTLDVLAPAREYSGIAIGNELFLFAVFALSFPLAMLVLCGSDRKSWCTLASGILIAIMTGTGKRFEAWIGVPSESLFYEACWTLGLVLQGYGAMLLTRRNEGVGDLFAPGILNSAKLALVAGTYLATITLFYADTPAAGSIENATCIGIFGCMAAVGLTSTYRRFQDAFIGHARAVIRGEAKLSTLQHKLPSEVRDTLSVLVQERDEILRWKVAQEHRLAHEQELNRTKQAVRERIMHDIRSPLAALRMASEELSSSDGETTFLIRTAVDRIRDMAHEFLASGREDRLAGSVRSIGSDNVARHLEAILAQKRSELRQHRSLAIELQVAPADRFLFCNLQPDAFHALISNLLNNAAEAMNYSGTCRVSIERVAQSHRAPEARLVVQDEGPGMPADVLAQLQQGVPTSSKRDGNGIGLLSAKSAIEAWGGAFAIESGPDHIGTRIVMDLPIQVPPPLTVTELTISAGTVVVVVDDEKSIHQVWDRLLNKHLAPDDIPQLIHCYSVEDFEAAVEALRASEAPWIGLVDHELRGGLGLDLVLKHGVAANCILVSSHDMNKGLRDRCADAQIGMLSKVLVPYIRLSVGKARQVA